MERYGISDTIMFYRVTDDFGVLSNFAMYEIEVEGKIWPSSEHYFQAQKFTTKTDRDQICSACSPMDAAILGRDRKKTLRKDWEYVKVDVMRKAVLAKFSQHDRLRDILISTGQARLVEHTLNDSYWGDGGDGKGRNMLGEILMEVREQLISSVPSP